MIACGWGNINWLAAEGWKIYNKLCCIYGVVYRQPRLYCNFTRWCPHQTNFLHSGSVLAFQFSTSAASIGQLPRTSTFFAYGLCPVNKLTMEISREQKLSVLLGLRRTYCDETGPRCGSLPFHVYRI
jgi:hypothetical protein